MQKRLDTIREEESVRLVARLAGETGVEAYLAGGGLRDALLGRAANDLDFALSGGHVDIPRRFAQTWGGTFFWLDEERQQARVVKKIAGGALIRDFAPFRGETVEDDLRQRDFTINALALPVTGTGKDLVDPLAGIDDLRERRIRVCSAAAFDDDPLRLLRALRFSAELGFSLEGGTWKAICRTAGLIGDAAAERIRDELFRILAAPEAGSSFDRLEESGLWREILPPELRQNGTKRRTGLVAAVEGISSGLGRISPAVEKRLTDYFATETEYGISVRSLMKLAAGVGIVDKAGIAALTARLRLGRKAERILGLLCRDRAGLAGMPEKGEEGRTLFRFFRDREPAGPAMLILALAAGAVPSASVTRMLAYYVLEYDPSENDLLLSGEEIMEIAGIGEGRRVGDVMARLRDAEGEGQVIDREEARAFVKNLLTKEPPMG